MVNRYKVLLVEDDPYIRDAYKKILLKEDFEVAIAEDGKIALEIVDAYNPDIIILDMLMPEVDGIQFLEEYDVLEKHPDTKIIVLSNSVSTFKISKAMNLGALTYKRKSQFNPKQMVELIRTTLKTA